jgi:hypothetical protein
MTFDPLENNLTMFGGPALRDLSRFRKRRRDSLISCLIARLSPPPIRYGSVVLIAPLYLHFWVSAQPSLAAYQTLQQTFSHFVQTFGSLREMPRCTSGSPQ